MRLLAVLVLLLMLSTSSFGADLVKSTLSIPAYPDATPLMEVSVGEKNMLDSIKGVLSTFAAKGGMPVGQFEAMAEVFDLEGLAKALSGLKEVRVVELGLPQTTDLTPQKVTDFYAEALNKEKDWSRVYWHTDGPGKMISIYSLPKGSGLFVTSVRFTSKGRKVVVGRTSGRIDFGKVVEWAMKHLGTEGADVQKGESKPQSEGPEKKP